MYINLKLMLVAERRTGTPSQSNLAAARSCKGTYWIGEGETKITIWAAGKIWASMWCNDCSKETKSYRKDIVR